MIARRLIPALLIALLISGLFTFWLSRRFARPPVVTAAVKRFVAVSKAMNAGEQLQASSLELVDWPVAQPPQGAFQKQEDVAGRVLLFPLAAGEIVLDHQLTAIGAGAGLTARIPEGMRAISLNSDEVVGVAGFLAPGSFVDVLATYHAAAQADLITTTVLQDVKVLAAGQRTEPEPDGKASTADVVTLLVKPQDAEKLSLASSLGKLHFVLRNGADRKDVPELTPQMSLSGDVAPHEPSHLPHGSQKVSTATPRYTVQTIAGSKQTEETFEGMRR